MEAARIPWRPLGRLLVERGLLTADELERALAKQEQTGRRLGETLVECGFVSGPELSNALAAQYGIELTAETGFGTGLRTEIQRRHETDRRRVVRPVPSAADPAEPADVTEDEAEQAELEARSQRELLLHAQLEEQWAKLAGAEEQVAESHRELTSLARDYDRLRSQAARLAQLARRGREQLVSTSEQGLGVDERDEQIERLVADVRGCDVEIARLRGENVRAGDELAAATAIVAERDRLLEELRREAQRRRAQAVRFLERLRVSTPNAAPAAPPLDSHLVFVQLVGRYELVEREGSPPAPNSVLELPDLHDGALVVARLGRSPLPGDPRTCAFVTPAGQTAP